MNHVMIDLETLGTEADAIFITLGACKFDPLTGKIGDTFYAIVDRESARKAGRTTTQATLAWWDKQEEAAKAEIFKGGKPLYAVLAEFKLWIGRKAIVWGNGSSFDISILSNAYGEDKTPWKFWDVRDMRTIKHLAKDAGINTNYSVEGTKHNAKDDAVAQAKAVGFWWQSLVGGKVTAEAPVELPRLELDSPMPYGKHKDMAMQDVPKDYLLWLWNAGKKDDPFDPVGIFIKENLIDAS